MSIPHSSPEFTLGVSPVDHLERIETFLIRQFRNYTLFRMQRMISSGCVKIFSKMMHVGERVHAGDEMVVRLMEPPDKLYEPQQMPLDIIFEDPWLIVLDKPPGVVCHPVSRYQKGTICNALQAHLDRQTMLPGILRPGIVHRLDRLTSGLLVVSKTHCSHRGLVEQFENSEIPKEYLAVVEGVVEQNRGEIVRPIGASSRCGTLASVGFSARKKKLARTDFIVVKRYPEQTLVRAIPKTGRMHQIRIHFASIGHPVAGDIFYGEAASHSNDLENPSRLETDADSLNRHMLHASALKFRHPIFHCELAFRLPFPADFANCLEIERNTFVFSS